MLLNIDSIKLLKDNGEQVALTQLKVGDKLTGLSRVNTVKEIRITSYHPDMVLINGDLPVSIEQPIYSSNGEWVTYASVDREDIDTNILGPSERVYHTTYGHKATTDIQELQTKNTSIAVEISLDGDHTFVANGYLLHNKGGGGGNQTTVQKSEPPAYLKPYLTDIARQAQQAYRDVPQGGFQGELTADPTGSQLSALQQQKDLANSLGDHGQATTQIAQRQSDQVLSGAFRDPLDNNFQTQSADTAGVIDAAIDPIQQRLVEQIIPQIQSQAIQDGAYGGTRQDVTTGNALQDFSREATNTAAMINYEDFARSEDQRFQDHLGRMQLTPELLKLEQAAALTAPEIANLGVQQQLLPSQLLNDAGSRERMFQQDAIDDLYQQYLLQTQTPFAGLDQYASIVSGTPSGQTSTLTGPRSGGGGSSVLSGALGGAGLMAGAGSAGMLGAGALAGPVGLAGGAILGGLLGGL